MNYATMHNLLKEQGVIFLLAVDPETLPFGHIASFSHAGEQASAVFVPATVKQIRSYTTHIHPDITAGKIWEALKKTPLIILQINSPSIVLRAQNDDTLSVSITQGKEVDVLEITLGFTVSRKSFLIIKKQENPPALEIVYQMLSGKGGKIGYPRQYDDTYYPGIKTRS